MAEDPNRTIAEVDDHLAATAELPLEPAANRWLGEAHAVVSDLRTGDPDRETLRRRLEIARSLMAEVESTGHDEADAHLVAARDLVDEALAGLETDSG